MLEDWYPLLSCLIVVWACYKIYKFAEDVKIPVLNWFSVALVIASFYNVERVAVGVLLAAALLVILNHCVSNSVF